MCKNIQQTLVSALNRVKDNDANDDLEYFKKELSPKFKDHYLARGVTHPEIVVYTNENPFRPELSFWGLVPEDGLLKEIYWKSLTTLIVDGESMFKKKSLQKSAEEKRCLIPVNGFYEYYTEWGKRYPIFVSNKKDEPFYIAGLWSEWFEKKSGITFHTFAIVTTNANPFMVKIHNKPRTSTIPRMPVILPKDLRETWLNPLSKPEIQELASFQYPEDEMEAWTVRSLIGLNSASNDPSINDKLEYPGLEINAELSLYS